MFGFGPGPRHMEEGPRIWRATTTTTSSTTNCRPHPVQASPFGTLVVVWSHWMHEQVQQKEIGRQRWWCWCTLLWLWQPPCIQCHSTTAVDHAELKSCFAIDQSRIKTKRAPFLRSHRLTTKAQIDRALALSLGLVLFIFCTCLYRHSFDPGAAGARRSAQELKEFWSPRRRVVKQRERHHAGWLAT